jgi:hypothetical protein
MNEQVKALWDRCVRDYGHTGTEVCVKIFAELLVGECLSEIKSMIVDESELLYSNNEETIECVNERLMDTHDNIAMHFGFAEHFGVDK